MAEFSFGGVQKKSGPDESGPLFFNVMLYNELASLTRRVKVKAILKVKITINH
jgi:hypothetical protein